MRVWTTTHLPPAQQFGYWRECLCEAFTALDPVAPSRVASHELADLSLSHLQSRAHVVRRGPHEIRRNPSEFFFANLQLAGRCRVQQDGRTLQVLPGDLYLVDTTRPYELVQQDEDWQNLVCRIPRARLLPQLAAPREATARRLPAESGLGQVALGYIRQLHQADEADRLAQEVLAASLASLLGAAFGASEAGRARGADAVRRATHAALVRHVEGHLADPALDVATVAARFRISPRYLHKLFEASGRSFSRTVQEARLQRCAQDLACGSARTTVSEIAFRWGFNDLPQFSRAFRRRYGQTASDYRQAMAGVAAVAPWSSVEGEARRLDDR